MPCSAHYGRHPDPRQEALFFGLLRECVEQGKIGLDLLRAAMAANHIRHDALERLAAAPAVDDLLAGLAIPRAA